MIQDSFPGPVTGHIGTSKTYTSPQRVLVDRYQERQLYFVTKRVFDVIVACLGLLVLSPVLLFIALMIKLDSRGPVFFVHQRVGARQRRSRQSGSSWEVATFPFVKFRSMTTGADESAHREYVRQWASGHAQANGAHGEPKFKMQNDARITRVGRWIR